MDNLEVEACKCLHYQVNVVQLVSQLLSKSSVQKGGGGRIFRNLQYTDDAQ